MQPDGKYTNQFQVIFSQLISQNKERTFCYYNNMKNIIQSVLVKHLGKYVDGLKNSLDIGLLDGEVTIENVSLKTSFINQLGLPFTLRYSHIEKIHIQIPWTSLKDKSTVVTVKGIYALFSIDYDQKEEEINTQQVFKGILERIRMEMKKKWTQSHKDETFAEKNLIRIVDNAVLNINNIHIRFQSYKRNWDYSIGMIIDNINSYTVDEYQQKSFYQRSFSKKENNKPFNKLLNIQTFQIYFNDNEQVFIINQQPKNRALLFKMMAHPFAYKEKDKSQQTSSGKKKHIDKSNDQIKTYPTYSLKNIAVIALQAIGTQRFAQDMRYNVELNVNITKIDISLSDRQLSQLIYMIQHFYDFALNKDKNGGKQFNFEQSAKKIYRSVITKIARDQKLTRQQSNEIEQIIYHVPTSLLQQINDQVINDVRIQKQVKKINKVSNTEKSKQMMEDLLAKKEKLTAMQGVDLFKEVTLYVKIDRIVTALFNSFGPSVQKFSEFGLYNIILECVMDLNWFIRVSCKFYKQLFKYKDKEITSDLYDLKLPWLHISAEIMKDQLKKMQVALQKKEYVFDQNALNDLINWISLIRIKPSLLNYILEMLNYSIDITRVMMEFMFHKGRQLNMSFSMPIVTIKLDATSNIKIDFGHFFGQNSQKNDQYQLRYMQPVQIHSNDLRIFEMGMGTVINLQDKIQKQTTYQQVIFNIPKIEVTNVEEIIRLIYAFRTSGALSIIKKYSELQLLDTAQEEELEGQFYLNKIKHKLNMKLSRTQLVFTPVEQIQNFPDQRISLTRTKVYKLITGKRFFIVFKEEVDRLVNIVQAVSEKVAGTIFQKLKDYIHQISTSFQWHKYHKTPYQQNIHTLQEIQDINLINNILMTLTVNIQKMSLQFSQDSHLKIQKAGGKIKYNQFNTEAAIQLLKVDLIVQSEKVIYDASFKGRYEYLQSMCVELEVLKLGYQIKLHRTLTNLIKVVSKYELLIFDLRYKRKKNIVQIEEDETKLSQIKSQNSRTDNLFKFLLQKKFSIQTTNIFGYILGYCNKLSYIKLDIQKYRNQSEPRILAQMKGIVLLSMIQLPLISLKHTSTQLQLQLDSINAEIDISVLIYEIIKGQGSLILKQFLKAYRDRQIAKIQLMQSQQKENSVKSFKSKAKENKMENYLSKRIFTLTVDYIRVELSITGHLSLGFLSKNILLQKGRLSWDGLIFTLNKQCISINQNNAILKWTPSTVNFVMTNVKLKLNSKEVIFLFNQLFKIYTFVKRSNFDLLQLVEEEISNPDQKGRVLQQTKKNITIRIQELQVIYECADKHPLISIRMKPIFLTNQTLINTINLSLWHLNRSLKLYEPIIEPFQLKIVEKPESNQLDLLFENIYIVLTQQLAVDILQQIKLLKQIKNQLQKDQSNELQQMNDQELKFIKRNLFSQHYQEYTRPNFQKTVQYSFTLKIKSYLNCRCLVEVTCGKAQKQILDYEDNPVKEGVIHTISIAQKTSYTSSYELIERYQKINLKICLQNHFYYASPFNISFLLYDKDNIYITPVIIVDQNGHEINSHLAVKVQYSEGVYMVDIMSMYTIKNQTNLALHFRYSDMYSINKFVLNKEESVPLALWIVQSVKFGIEEDNFCHLLKLRQDEQFEGTGYYELSIRKDENCSVKVIINKQKITHQQRKTPKLKYLKVKKQQNPNDQQHPFNQQNQQSSEQEKENVEKEEEAIQAHCFTYNIIAGIIVKNHLLFPIKVNDHLYENEQPQQLLFLYQDKQKKKEYLKLGLGDGTIHEVFMPDVQQSINVNLKLYDQNFVVVYLQVRKNKQHQRVLHIYAEVQLVMNVHNMFVPILKTNIYNHYFIMKKQVKNNHSDKIHPSPILKDKFVFSTYHYLLSLQERYISAKLHDCTSNQIILYHSDYDTDLKFRQPDSQQDSYVFAVSYNTKIIQLQVDQQGRKSDILECNYTYIMPKYYLINRSEESFVVQGNTIIRSGQKIALDRIQNIELNVRDQVQFKYMCKSFDESNYILFIRGKQESKEKTDQNKDKNQDRRNVANILAKINSRHEQKLQGISEYSQLESSSKHDQIQIEEQLHEQKETKDEKAKSLVLKRNKNALIEENYNEIDKQPQIEIQKLGDNQNKIEQEYTDQEQDESQFTTISHRVKMEDIIIFAMSKRVCDYNTISYQIHQWHQWLSVQNQLTCPIVLRTKLNVQVLGQEIIESGKTGKIISGLSDKLQISLVLNGEQIILDRYNLNQRLNHTLFLNNCDFKQIILKETKVKLGRFLLIENPNERRDKNVYKAITSLNVLICKVSISLVLNQQKMRKELVRVNINHPKMMLLSYKNGLYMGHLKFDQIVAMCKRNPFLIMKDFQGYIQGFKGQFVQRIAVDLKQTLQLNLTDQMIATFIGQIQIFEKYLPKASLLQSEEIILQEEQTYHINSIGIKPIQIKLCLKKVLSEMTEEQARLLNKISLSMMEIEDATINLSPIQINVPLKQKHINGITKMYAMQAFVGVASGLNILGNPAQFMSQFQAGRNRGGVIPVMASMVAGITNSISKIIGTIGSGFSELTFDREFIRNRIKQKNRRAQNFGQGLKSGLKQLALSIKDGFVGLVYQPIQGHQEEGGIGILKGTFFGITGLVTKPVSGIFLAISKTIQGINSTMSNMDYDSLVRRQLITRPLYHKFKMVRPYRSEDELAYNILLNWYDYKDVQLVGSFLLESQQGDSVVELLIVTCSELIMIDLNDKTVVLKLRMEELLATGKFTQGVVLYFHDGKAQDSQEQLVFRLSRDNAARQNLYHTLKAFISLHTQV